MNRVSVCMATYNGAKYIKEQLDSILCQLGENDEIIISDDSSKDDTIAIIKAYNDKRIHLFENQSFHSPVFNFENALKHASGNYICLCDQDDIWLPNKLDVIKEYLDTFVLVVSDCKIVDADLNVLHKSFFHLHNSKKGFLRNWIRNSYLGCCMAFRKEVLNIALPFPKKIAMHDIWIGLLVNLHGKVEFINTPLVLYRRHGENASFGAENSKYSLSFKIKYRMVMLYYLLKRAWSK